MYRVKADLMRPEDGACVINVAGEEVMRCESLQQAAVVRNALNSELAARDKRIAELEAAIESYRTGVDWGKVYAWLQHGAPTEGEGIAMAKRIIHLHVNADALAGGES